MMFSIHSPASPRLLVNSQNVTGSENGSVTITCYHQEQSGVKWCKFGGQCITGASGTLDGASVEIRYGLRNTTVSMKTEEEEHGMVLVLDRRSADACSYHCPSEEESGYSRV